jgi:hypothetical protein
MTWPNQDQWKFNEAQIKERALATSGVYLIGSNEENIYLGASDDMRKSLLGHLNGDRPCILEKRPIWFSCSPASAQSRDSLRDGYIVALRPACS